VTGQLLTARTVAERLGVTAATVLRWTRQGQLPGIHLPGGAVRYREEELEQWLAQRAAPGRGVRTTTPDAALGTLPSLVRTTTDYEE
jgi:excisionase family DNA binding protein